MRGSTRVHTARAEVIRSRWPFRQLFECGGRGRNPQNPPEKGTPFPVTVPLAERGRARTLRGAGDRDAAYVVPCGLMRSWVVSRMKEEIDEAHYSNGVDCLLRGRYRDRCQWDFLIDLSCFE
jgi:alpha-D-ribose 1-methylphosphonate 5-triphosphate synthase subunit PhnH